MSNTEKKKIDEFEPKIIAFSCNWCSYTSADLAGINRYKYPSCVNIIRFMCSGRIEAEFIMKAFEYGADGVIVTGCKLDECHYISGNYRAKERIETTQQILDMLGLDSGRLRAEWLTASEGEKFVNTMNEFVEQIKALGPNPLTHSK
ncbi:MAG: hydrogenase iron-sulfur subunit [Methanomassiliicoccales archaeon]|nr:MAG: hydrogenase iron-sulfur subunit [Methanomassiliicoccales archaeon]